MTARRLRALKHERLCESRCLSASLSPFQLEIELDGLPPMTNAQRGHWAVQARDAKRWKLRTRDAAYPHKPNEPLTKAKVTVTRYSTREPDFDGLVSGAKRILDGLVMAGVMIDDKPSVIGQPVYLWEKAPYGHGRVRVKIEQLNKSKKE